MAHSSFIPFNQPVCLAASIAYMTDAARRGEIRGDFTYGKKCSAWMEQRFGAERVLLTPSGTDALEMAAILCDIHPGDEVILPSFTFSSTANAFALRGARLVFVDVRPDTMNIDERLIEAAVTERTRVIVPVHYGGVACEMDTIMDIARRHHLLVVEDAAQGVMATYKGRALGTIGDFGCYSFHETKNYSMGEGGALVINHAEDVARAEIIREKGTNRAQFLQGQVDKYTWVDIGSSFLPSDLNAAFLYAQLEQADAINDERRRAWELYRELLQPLADAGRIELPVVPDGCRHNGHLFFIKVRDIEERTALSAYLKEHGVIAIFHYIPLHSTSAGLRYGRFHGEDRYTTRESSRLLRLPMHSGLREEDIQYIAGRIGTFLSHRGGQMSFVGSRCEARSACSRDTSSLDAQAHDLIALGKQKIKESVLHKEWGQVATFIAILANWMYLQNAVRTDDFLERHIELLTRKVHLATAVPEKPNPGVVLFYDFFGDDLRGLVLIFLRALARLGYQIVYCVGRNHRALPHIEAVLADSGGKMVELSPFSTQTCLVRDRELYAAMAAYAPEIAMMYTGPHDVGGVLAFERMAGHTRRYQLDLTDHAFWLGRNAFDVCMEFRDFGAKIARTERKIPAGKLIKQRFYPVIDKTMRFDGLPFERQPGDVVLFSGGSVYKTMDRARTYYRIVDAILAQHPQVKFLYAGGGSMVALGQLQHRYPGRVFLMAERQDFYQLLCHCDLYFSTYPFVGSLTAQYAAMAGLVPITYHPGMDPLRDLIIDADALGCVHHTIPSLLAFVTKLIEHPEERARLGQRARASVVTEAQFTENLGRILQRGTSVWPIEDIDAINLLAPIEEANNIHFSSILEQFVKMQDDQESSGRF